jgi:hypothetical protein
VTTNAPESRREDGRVEARRGRLAVVVAVDGDEGAGLETVWEQLTKFNKKYNAYVRYIRS